MQANIEAVDDDHCRIEIKCPKCGKINGIIV
jgi:phage FluMu protein Com